MEQHKTHAQPEDYLELSMQDLFAGQLRMAILYDEIVHNDLWPQGYKVFPFAWECTVDLSKGPEEAFPPAEKTTMFIMQRQDGKLRVVSFKLDARQQYTSYAPVFDDLGKAIEAVEEEIVSLKERYSGGATC